MRNVFTISILLLVLFAAKFSFAQATKYTDADAYEVYSVVIASEWPVRVAKAQKLVIETETTDYPGFGSSKSLCLVPAPGQEATYNPLLDAYRVVNKKTWLLQPNFVIATPYELVSAASIKEIFAEKGVDGWQDFYAKYPHSGGAISMSAVGFNADKTLALVYLGHSCGGLCGGGEYHVLSKTNGKWSELRWPGNSCGWRS